MKIKKSGAPDVNIFADSLFSLMPSVEIGGKLYTAANYGNNKEKMIERKSGPNMWEIVVSDLQLADSDGNLLPLTVDQTYYFWNEKLYVATKWKPSASIKDIEVVKLGTNLNKTLFNKYNSGSSDKDLPTGGLLGSPVIPGQITVFNSSNSSNGAFTYKVINNANTDSVNASVSGNIISIDQRLYDMDKHGAKTLTWLGGEYKYTYTQMYVSGKNSSADGINDTFIENNPLTGDQFEVTGSIPYSGSDSLGYDNTSGCYVVDVSVPSLDYKDPNAETSKNIYPSVKLNVSNPYDLGRKIRLKVQQPQVSGFSGDGSRYLPNTTGSVGILTDENMNPIGYSMQENSKWDDDSGIVNWECNVMHIGYFDISAKQDRAIWYRQSDYNWGNKPMVGINSLDIKDYQSRGDLWLETHIGAAEINCFQPDVQSPVIADVRAIDYGSSGTGNISASGGELLRISTDGGNNFIQTSRKGPGYRVESVGPNLSQFSMSLQSPDAGPDFTVNATSILTPGIQGSRNFFKLRYDFNSDVTFNDIKNEMRLFTLSSENFGATTAANQISYIGSSGSQVNAAISHANKWDVTAAPLGSSNPWFALNDSSCNVGLVICSADGQLGGQSFGMNNLAVSEYSNNGGKNPAYLVPNVNTNSVQKGDYIEMTVELFSWSDPASMKIAAEAAGWPTSVSVTNGNDATVVSNLPAELNVGASGVADFTVDGGVEYNVVSVDGFDSYAQPLLEEYKNGSWITVDQSVSDSDNPVNYVKGKDFWQTDYNEVSGKYKFTYALPADGNAHRYRLSLADPTAAPAYAANWPLSKPVNARNYLEAFSFPEQLSESRRNYSKNTVEVIVRDGSDLTKLTPSITVSEYATVSPASGVQQDFSGPVKYTVTAENGDKREWTVNVSVQEPYFESFKLPGQVGASLVDRSAHKVTVKMPEGTDLTSVTPSEVKLSAGAAIVPSVSETQDFSKAPVEYTITGPEGVPHVWSIVVTTANSGSDEDPLVKNMNDAIADVDNWNLIGSASKTAGAGYVKFDGGAAVYKGATYQNEMLEMNLKTNNTSGTWPLIAIRMQKSDTEPYASNSCYLVVMKNDILELQKFSNGTQKYFINDKANTYIKPNQVHKVQFGAINVGDDAVRLIFTVDGVTVFDYLDTDADRITAPGYFGVGAASNPVTLSVVPEVTKLNDAIADVDNWNLIGSASKTASQTG